MSIQGWPASFLVATSSSPRVGARGGEQQPHTQERAGAASTPWQWAKMTHAQRGGRRPPFPIGEQGRRLHESRGRRVSARAGAEPAREHGWKRRARAGVEAVRESRGGADAWEPGWSGACSPCSCALSSSTAHSLSLSFPLRPRALSPFFPLTCSLSFPL
jgi:hypothetical protein